MAGDERMEVLAAALPAVVLVADGDGTFTFAGGAALDAYGVSGRDLVGTSALARYSGRPEILDAVERALVGQPAELVAEFGGRMWEAKALPLCTGTGDAVGAVAVAFDVTDRIALEHERRLSDERYRQIVETAREGVWMIGLDGSTLVANQAMADMLGVPLDMLLASSVFDLWPPELHGKLVDALGRRAAGVSEVVEDRLVRRDGTALWTIRSATPVTDGDRVVAALAMFTDVTAQRAATARNRFHAQVLAEIREPVVAIELDGTITYLNAAASQVFGLPDTVACGVNVFDLTDLPSDWASELRVALADTLAHGSYRREYTTRAWSGAVLTTVCTYRLYHDADGVPAGVVLVAFDVTEVTAARDAVHRRAVQHEAIAELSTFALRPGRLGDLAQRAVDVTATVLSADHVSIARLVGDDVYAQVASTGASTCSALSRGAGPMCRYLHQLARDQQVVVDDPDLGDCAAGSLAVVPITLAETRGIIAATHAERSRFTTADADFLRAVGNVLASAWARNAAEQQLAHQALHDPLTGLPNRALLLDRAARARARSGHRLAMLVIDVDHFALVNEALGHERGDEVLVLVAERLAGVMAANDTVARLGGDTFAFVCDGIRGLGQAGDAAQRVLDALEFPFCVGGDTVYLTLSVGIAMPVNGEDALDLLRNAQNALHRAKRSGGAQAVVFDDNLLAGAVDHLALSTELRTALPRGELRLVYQPEIDLRSGEVRDVEALLRWEHPARGLLAPDEFLPLADELGLLAPIGAWVTATALRDLQSWSQAGAPGVGVAINLSAADLDDPGLVGRTVALLSETGLDPRLVTFEITETTAMRDPAAAAVALGALRHLGVRIAVDDFGTGYSSMAYLRRLPIDSLKIDREFTDGVARAGDDAVIVQATISLAHALHLEAIAEGVETDEQAAALVELGCDVAQGWLYAAAMPAEQVAAFCERRRRGGTGSSSSLATASLG